VNEHEFIRSVHRHIPSSETYAWKINDVYAGGVADAFYCDVGGVLFCEYKYLPRPPVRPGTVIVPKLSSSQALWLKSRFEQNVPVVVVLGTPQGNIMFTGLSWEAGVHRQELDEYGLSQKAIARIILDHCKGTRHVEHNEQTYPNCRRSGESETTQVTLGVA